MKFYQKESCYLSDQGKQLVDNLIAKGLDEDLALEVAHISIPSDQLYELEVSDEKGRSTK
jgi:hypothetical protein